METLSFMKTEVRITLQAAMNQRQLSAQGMAIPVHVNWPEPNLQRTISTETWNSLKTWFLNEVPLLPEFASFFSSATHRYEQATSAGGGGVHDLKISPIVGLGASGPTVFNYHVLVVNGG